MNTLFDQLGLESSDEKITAFIEKNKPIPLEIPLHQAYFWGDEQQALLKQLISEDADWAIVVDDLNARLRESKS
jgi:hypothetical protein